MTAMRGPLGVTKLSVVVPCFNEERTLRLCVERLLDIRDATLALEIVIVDDRSTDRSGVVARELAARHSEIVIVGHARNRGKGAALRTGFRRVTGDFVAVQDADLEYDPQDLKRLLEPLREGVADVVLGSRFLPSGRHRVLYFWHSVANRMLTVLSNMFTDLNLSDMETGYKVFRRDVVEALVLHEDRFGIEPELVAEVARLRLRVYEMGISYSGRTYDEGKKIRGHDAARALYCILRYNAHSAPLPMQYVLYLAVGGTAGLVNLLVFLSLLGLHLDVTPAALGAFAAAALVNYFLCVLILFRHRAYWGSIGEVFVYAAVVVLAALVDLVITHGLIAGGLPPGGAKALAAVLGVFLNFAARRFVVFPERPRGPWAPSQIPGGSAAQSVRPPAAQAAVRSEVTAGERHAGRRS
jgi:glycosyltransferase involved in cell wall biosynthesis